MKTNLAKFSNLKNTLSHDEMRNVMGGWDGICGFYQNGGWQCGTAAETYTYQNVVSLYQSGYATGWCCASCTSSGYC